MSTQQYVIKRFDDEGQFQGYISIDSMNEDNTFELSLVPTLAEATKFTLSESDELHFTLNGKKVEYDLNEFITYSIDIPLSCLMVTVESEGE
jgi:hypothetical protein